MSVEPGARFWYHTKFDSSREQVVGRRLTILEVGTTGERAGIILSQKRRLLKLRCGLGCSEIND
jgi:hypothetical protein